MSDVDIDAVRVLLHAKRADICALLDGTQEDAAPVELDQTQQGRVSRIDAITRQQMAAAARRRRQQDLARIDAALARLADGCYGDCVRCEEPVEPARLEIDPATPLCRACASAN